MPFFASSSTSLFVCHSLNLQVAFKSANKIRKRVRLFAPVLGPFAEVGKAQSCVSVMT